MATGRLAIQSETAGSKFITDDKKHDSSTTLTKSDNKRFGKMAACGTSVSSSGSLLSFGPGFP